MSKIRAAFCSLILGLILAVVANGVAMASNGVLHQAHCLDAKVASEDAASDHSDHHHHADTSNDDAFGHDHETCMMHACSAVTQASQKLPATPLTVSAATRVPEAGLLVLERAEGLNRPPNL